VKGRRLYLKKVFLKNELEKTIILGVCGRAYKAVHWPWFLANGKEFNRKLR